MKRTLIILFLLVSVFCAPADAQPCPEGINHITDCPDVGCGDHAFDPELNKRKNIRSDVQEPAGGGGFRCLPCRAVRGAPALFGGRKVSQVRPDSAEMSPAASLAGEGGIRMR